MENRRKHQILMIMILFVAIASLTVGFAAFSATLQISSAASVQVNANDFNVIFVTDVNNTDYNSNYSVVGRYSHTPDKTENASLVQHSITGIKANFDKPGQSITYNFFAKNVGMYDAYLTGINISNVNESYKNCIAEAQTTNSLVQNACQGIDITIKIDNEIYNLSENVSGHILTKGSAEQIEITISYDSMASYSDGPFSVDFGIISLNYSSVDSEIEGIKISNETPTHKFYLVGETFLIDNTTTWQDIIDKTNGMVTYKTIDDNGFVYGELYVNGKGGATGWWWKNGEIMGGTPSELNLQGRIIADLWGNIDEGYFMTLGGYNCPDYNECIADFEYIKENYILYGYIELIK